jgi:schlafen family protein
VTAAWVNAVLDGDAQKAANLATTGLPIHLTRDLQVARRWLRANAKGQRRAGLLASSGAARLRAEGIESPTFDFLRGIDYVKWFLEPAGDYRSSNQLEVALSEFETQGLELDLAGLLWGGDLIFPQGQVLTRRLKGMNWTVVAGTDDPQASADDPRIRIKNKYRVLLTRFRKGMVIFIPLGSADDQTRALADFDGVYEYLLHCGVRPLDADSAPLDVNGALSQTAPRIRGIDS